ncbi:MAG: metalloregulator ArsR/SmtB family transcription factor [Firmicutes bacterium]|uniref:Transcriptional regulator n=1 Tax=Kroppenstedtia guangzhouensis TaxID=1274356 RepID=A0ABQ1H5D3_9BACL|nr:metalloregulator ArsR/SmtB family transcription factor [Kroppenstedtia guangzhouensis]EGK10270.1 cadmium efflux system accessory protein [Desmospora sp. 8437]MDA8353147.1 metalloregulator ArsR/SmtB family transcription factor [Bacillota bacterium]GGA57340.1 transcriptional regulator [Kroppenstedtia guangzhouensis]
MSKDRCEVYCYDEEKVQRVQPLIKIEDFVGTAQLLKALADATRLKIAYALVQEEELCVCDVANIIGSSMATASHHLRLLRNMRLAKYRKEGKLVFYSLDDDHIRQLVQLAFDHHKEMNPVETSK